ncbi:hypothetical protein BH11MYX3_BH11MYX3_02490 [soil metagenome]
MYDGGVRAGRYDLGDPATEETGSSEILEALRGGTLRLLTIVDDIATTHDIPSHGRLTLGRAGANDISLAHESVSRDHAFLDVVPLTIIDRGSRNGTHVRGAAIDPGRPMALTVNEPIRLGDVVLVIKHATASTVEHSDAAPSPVNLAAECARAARSCTSFVVARVLVDRSVAASAIAAVLGTVRVYDQLSHDQDGEFLVLFPDTPAESLERVIDRLISALGAAEITARVGVARFPGDGTTPAQLVARTWQQVSMNREVRDPMDAVRDTIALLAVGDLSILLCGETGVGKDLYAEIIHRSSTRSRGPLIKVNCAALTASLLESELFGHERGAFTDASSAHTGLIEAADGGTLFLDEIGELPLALQAKLLRVVEDREATPGRRDRQPACRCAVRRRHQSISRSRGRSGAVSPRPVVPDRRSDGDDSAAAPAA